MEGEHLSSTQKLIYSIVCICCVLIGGVMSGLTLGLMSLDTVDLEVLVRSGSPNEKRYAKRIQPALPIFLDKLLSPVLSIVLSVTAVLTVGEIIPQALCKSYALPIGNYCAPMVRVLCYAVGVISWPVSKLLDYVLGNEHTALFRRAQLKALVTMHSIEENYGGHLSATEINIIGGALDLTNKTAAHAMTPLDKVFMLSADAVLNVDTLSELLASGHSRVPVYMPGDREAVIGLLLVKELVLIDMFSNIPVSSLSMRPIPQLRADTAMYDLLKLFQTGRTHMVLLTQPPPGARLLGSHVAGSSGAARGEVAVNIEPELIRRAAEEASQRSQSGLAGFGKDNTAKPVGIITIEDVIEELLQQEIVDETDTHVDNMRLQKVPTSQRSSINPASLTTPRMASILRGQNSISRANSDPLPPRISLNSKHPQFIVTNGAGEAAKVEYIPPGGRSPVKWGRLPSLSKASTDSRQRRKPFKSNSNRSLKGLHSQMLAKHGHHQDSGKSEQSGTGNMDTASESYDAPVDHSVHLEMDGVHDGMNDDGKSSVISQGTFATNTSSSNGYGGPAEVKPLVKYDHDEHPGSL